jgi:hypothetical protein
LVHLPACRYVIETHPKADFRPYVQTILSVAPTLPQLGALEAGVCLDSLLFALLAEAVADIRRIREVHRGEIQPALQRRAFSVWERGQIVSSAGFLLDFSHAWNLPSGAIRLSRSVLQAEEPYLDELVAASVAGLPWRKAFPHACLRCGKPGSWHAILRADPNAPLEITWRYQRPENAVPICHHCAETLNLRRREDLQFDLVWGLWGPRFQALWQWHQAVTEGRLPEWNRYAHPLWPPQFGGESWETGSGALQHTEPRLPAGVQRGPQHLEAMRRVLYHKRFRGRQPGETHLQRLLDFHFEGDLS